MQLYTSTELSNESYHALPQIGGSALSKIFHDCPAAWKYGDHSPTKALVDGIAAHVCVLEPALFNERFVRGIDPVDHPKALDTGKQMEAWLKERGIKGYSGKVKAELTEMILHAEPDTQILERIIADFIVKNEGKTVVKPADFDMINQMRRVVFADPMYRRWFEDMGTQFEFSAIGDEMKCRFDCLPDGRILDFKTAISAHPMEFARSAAKNGYWLKMALQNDLFVEAFGDKPKSVILLAQSKKQPYIPQAYELTDEQLRVGRQQYQQAYDMYRAGIDRGHWPAYGGGVMTLQTPGYMAYEYGMEDELELIEG